MKQKFIRHIIGILLIIVGIALLIYDFLSPPVGELSNFTLILFAKLIAVAGSVMNVDIERLASMVGESKPPVRKDYEDPR